MRINPNSTRQEQMAKQSNQLHEWYTNWLRNLSPEERDEWDIYLALESYDPLEECE